ncbi:hypothetical protein V5O48_019241, partial [Marasmius crinis-equi]
LEPSGAKPTWPASAASKQRHRYTPPVFLWPKVVGYLEAVGSASDDLASQPEEKKGSYGYVKNGLLLEIL